MFQDNFLIYFLFNVLRLLFVSFGSIFYEFSSLSHTKISLHLHSLFSLLLLHIYMSIALHANPSQIHSDKNRCHLPSIFNDTYITPTLQYYLILTRISRLWPWKWACISYSVTVAYNFGVTVGHCGYCEGHDLLCVFGCLGF